MTCVRERLWVWGHPTGSHNGRFNLSGRSSMTPAQGAQYLGVPNMIMVTHGGEPAPPLEPHAQPMREMDRLVWSIVGDRSSTRHDRQTDLDAVLELARQCPNLDGAIMDDFFGDPAKGRPLARYEVEQIGGFRDALHRAVRPLDLWVVLYDHELHLPVAPHLAMTDVVTLWVWQSERLVRLPEYLDRAEQLAPDQRHVLGCYLWDYGNDAPMPLKLIQEQCRTGLRWLKEGRIEGMIFLATCIFDLELPTVAWVRDWIAEVGDELLKDEQ